MDTESYVKSITPQDENFSRWYTDVVRGAELADYAPVRGCIVVRPHGYAIWENIQNDLDARFKATGVQNAYFPMLIPESIFAKEAEHIEGFAPEVPWVTHAGQEELQERLGIRPSSETIIGTMFAKWIESYRDLPMLINQWCSVMRWEKATYPFLRTSEFLWQEGHTCHRNEEEARERAEMMIEVYRSFIEDTLAIPVAVGLKSESEKFAGAVDTFTVEALMRDGRALQAGTSHYLGSGFAGVLGIQYLDEDGQLKPVHQTSWGVSHRLIGGLIMVHGDNRGLVLPPAIAPVQVVVVPIYRDDTRDAVLSACAELQSELDGVRIHIDDREEHTPGWKFNEWELRGTPLRIELGPRDLENDQVMMVRRDNGEKTPVPRKELAQTVDDMLGTVQEDMYERARQFQEDNTHRVQSIEELAALVRGERGFALGGWCGDDRCEADIKANTGATIRCLSFGEHQYGSGTCLSCGEQDVPAVIFARAY